MNKHLLATMMTVTMLAACAAGPESEGEEVAATESNVNLTLDDDESCRASCERDAPFDRRLASSAPGAVYGCECRYAPKPESAFAETCAEACRRELGTEGPAGACEVSGYVIDGARPGTCHCSKSCAGGNGYGRARRALAGAE